MSTLNGTSSAEIDAPLAQVWKIVEDVEIAPEWQGGLNTLTPIERDEQGRGTLCKVGVDIKVRTANTLVRFSYDGPTELRWTQEKGDVKSLDGSWVLEDLGGERTRATYTVDVDLGRMLSMIVRGPLVDGLRHMLAGARADELKARVEAG